MSAALVLLALAAGCASLPRPEETPAPTMADTRPHRRPVGLDGSPAEVLTPEQAVQAVLEYAKGYAVQDVLADVPEYALEAAMSSALNDALEQTLQARIEDAEGHTVRDALEEAVHFVPEDVLKDALEDAFKDALVYALSGVTEETLENPSDQALKQALDAGLADILTDAVLYVLDDVSLNVPSIWPTEHPKLYVSRGFYYAQRGRRAHKGIDMVVPRGTPVAVAADGAVTFAGRQSGYGNIVKIDHGNGLESWYAHLDSMSVQPGDDVIRGQEIGAVGSTGRATTSHLHYEVRECGAPVDPAPYLPPREGR